MNDEPKDHDLIDELVNDFVNRRLSGESPTVSEYCLRHPDLASKIRELFPMLDLLDGIKPEDSSAEKPVHEHPERIGDYRILSEIGHGGMGVVYEAEHEGLGRRVALKVISERIAKDDRARGRFQREARAVAKLHHTNIVPLFEAGEDQGRSFFAMQMISGQSLDRVIADGIREKTSSPRRKSGGSNHEDSPPSDASRVEESSASSTDSALLTAVSSSSGHQQRFQSIAQIGYQAADALQYAHERGIIHRDIKPSNLILDESGLVWLTDFGLAKTDDEEFTQPGDLLGTLRYMAPERFQGQCDERADVYGLGLALYELLTLKPAFQSSDRLNLIDSIQNLNLPAISNSDPRVPRDLETIVRKACDREPASRYQSARELREDLRRFLSHESIQARRTSVVEQAIRWGRRNRQLAGALAAISVLLVLFAAGASVAYYRESNFLHEAEITNDRLQRKLYAYEIQMANAAYQANNLGVMRQHLDECPEGLRDWEWHRFDWLGESRNSLTLRAFERPIFTPDGRYLITAGHRAEPDANAAKVWDLSTGQAVGPLMRGEGDLTSLALEGDGNRLLAGHANGMVIMWDLASRQQLWAVRAHTEKIDGTTFSRDGTRVATVSWDQTMNVLDATSGRVLQTVGPVGHRLRCVEFSASGEQIVTACYQAGNFDAAKVWDASDGRLLFELQGHAGHTESVAFSPDGRRILTGGVDGVIKLWNAANGTELATYVGHSGIVAALAFHPHGDEFASGSYDRSIRVWDIESPQEVTRFQPNSGVAWLSYDREGKRIASFNGPDVKVWELGGATDALKFHHRGIAFDCEFDPDGKRLATCGEDGTIQIWNLATGALLRVLRGHEAEVNSLNWHPTQELIASASFDGTVRLWDSKSGQLKETILFSEIRWPELAFSPDGTRLICIGVDNAIVNFDVASRKQIWRRSIEDSADSVAWSPDGRRIATGQSESALVLIWDAEAGTVIQNLEGGHHGVTFMPDGSGLVVGHRDGMIRLFDLSTGTVKQQFDRHQGSTESLAISPNARRLISGGVEDSAVKIWDAQSGEELVTLQENRSGVRAVCVSADGTAVASAAGDGSVTIWESSEASAQWEARNKMSKASRIVDRLFNQHTFQVDVLTALNMDNGINPEIRELATAIATTRGDDVLLLFRESWSVVISPNNEGAVFELARRKAAAACDQVPESGAFRTSLGVAEYRLGHYEEALNQLKRARSSQIIKTPVRNISNVAQGQKAVYPVNVAFLAMTMYKLGHVEQAKEELARLRALQKDKRWQHYRDTTTARQEAERLINGGG